MTMDSHRVLHHIMSYMLSLYVPLSRCFLGSEWLNLCSQMAESKGLPRGLHRIAIDNSEIDGLRSPRNGWRWSIIALVGILTDISEAGWSMISSSVSCPSIITDTLFWPYSSSEIITMIHELSLDVERDFGILRRMSGFMRIHLSNSILSKMVSSYFNSFLKGLQNIIFWKPTLLLGWILDIFDDLEENEELVTNEFGSYPERHHRRKCIRWWWIVL